MIRMPTKQKTMTKEEAVAKYQKTLHRLNIISFAALVLGVLAIFTSVASIYLVGPLLQHASSTTRTGNATNATGTTTAPASTLAGINQPLNGTSLADINDAPNAYFETAGQMYLNGSLTDPVYPQANNVTGYILNNKTSVIYYGSITCVWCGENRWAMALALSRFGNFSKLFTGYSSLGDSDVPTLYWNINNLNKSSDQIGNFYSSRYVNFFSIEDANPITGGFTLNPFSEVAANINALGNSTYINVFNYTFARMQDANTLFQGTPYTIWGNYQFTGADAAVFGNNTADAPESLTAMTHGQIFAQISNPTDQFGWGEYAAADVYVASLCKSLNNTAQVCSLPAIQSIEALTK